MSCELAFIGLWARPPYERGYFAVLLPQPGSSYDVHKCTSQDQTCRFIYMRHICKKLWPHFEQRTQTHIVLEIGGIGVHTPSLQSRATAQSNHKGDVYG